MAATDDAIRIRGESLSQVARTRGDGCQPLAELLTDAPVIPIKGDLRQTCIDNRVDLLVARRLTNVDLVPVVVPHAIELEQVGAVTAAVAGGPHSELAAAVAVRMATRLGVPGALATVHRGQTDWRESMSRFKQLARQFPRLERHTVEAPNAADLLETLDSATLLILGAPGGSWLQRQFFGQGHQLQVAARGGAVVVRDAPRRCFHRAVDAVGTALGPQLTVADARRIASHSVVPVADNGRLVGMLHIAALGQAAPHLTVADVMEPPLAVAADEPATVADDFLAILDGAPVPVVDAADRLIGAIPASTDAATGRVPPTRSVG